MASYNMQNLLKDLGTYGYFIGKLRPNDLEAFQSVIEEQFQEKILEHTSEHVCENLRTENYHKTKIANNEDTHKSIWAKHARILSEKRCAKLCQSDVINSLTSLFHWSQITNEANQRHGEMYFRLCRPRPFVDVGPLHADHWFWDLGNDQMPNVNFECKRLKFWVCINTSENKTGFRYVPKSHLQEYSFSSEIRDGARKPVFNENDHNLEIHSLNGGPGTFIIFDDKLLHGGEILESGTRVSLEFTLAVPH